jgi:hypothetical protein
MNYPAIWEMNFNETKGENPLMKMEKFLTGLFLVFFFGTTVIGSYAQNNLSIKAYGISDYQKNTPLYMMLLKVSDAKAAKYVIERQELNASAPRVKIVEKTYQEMVRSNFTYTDFGSLERHKRYKYFLRTMDETGATIEEVSTIGLVENIKYKGDVNQFDPVWVQNNATFTLGPKVDPENETLEYRLYTRVRGGGGEKLLESWQPAMDYERVTVSFPNTCEWQLVCIETDITIPDRGESVLVGWTLFSN